jgi:tricarballylate dehydrogenase
LEVNKSTGPTRSTPPFEAYAVTCGITFSFGGLKINNHAQVMSSTARDPRAVRSGRLVGGIFWFNYPGGSGLTNGSVFGRIAGENAKRLRAAPLEPFRL